MRPAEAAAVVVVGSLNMDIVVPVPRHPRSGETIIGSDSFRTPGGKGANQAVAAARLGQRVAMVGRVGGDDAGATLIAALNDYGVDYAHVSTTPEAPTGIALITVDPDGENIIVSPRARTPASSRPTSRLPRRRSSGRRSSCSSSRSRSRRWLQSRRVRAAP